MLSIIAFQVLAATYEQGVLVPVLSKTFGPTFHYEELTSWGVERQPLMADPYECRWCKVPKLSSTTMVHISTNIDLGSRIQTGAGWRGAVF